MGNIKIYLDTSVISALFDTRTPERQRLTEKAWITFKDYEVYISEKVLQEINQTNDSQKRALFSKAISGYNVLTVTADIEDLANEYIKQGIFSEKYFSDALHVALASVNGISYLLSWNFNHLVKVKTRRLIVLVNAIKDYPAVEIITPPEL